MYLAKESVGENWLRVRPHHTNQIKSLSAHTTTIPKYILYLPQTIFFMHLYYKAYQDDRVSRKGKTAI